jgi:hypothetical protein
MVVITHLAPGTEVDAGRVKDRDGVVRYLEGLGHKIPRKGKDYITVLDSTSGDRLRLKVGLYQQKGWNPRDMEAPRIRYGRKEPPQEREQAPELDPPDAGEYIHRELGDNTIDPAGPRRPSSPNRKQKGQALGDPDPFHVCGHRAML